MKPLHTAIVIALAVLGAAWLLGRSWNFRFRQTQTIVVTGLAEQDFTSDLVVWRGSFSRNAMEIRQAYQRLKEDEKAVRDFLKARGVPDSALVVSSVNLDKLQESEYNSQGMYVGSRFGGYRLSETIQVESPDLAKVEQLAREVTELLEQGIEFQSNAPQYYYTRLSDLKVDLLARASEDARLRAQTIAASSKASLGGLKKANMGVFQITGKNLNEDYSYGGAFNTSSREKTASITLRAEYMIR